MKHLAFPIIMTCTFVAYVSAMRGTITRQDGDIHDLRNRIIALENIDKAKAQEKETKEFSGVVVATGTRKPVDVNLQAPVVSVKETVEVDTVDHKGFDIKVTCEFNGPQPLIACLGRQGAIGINNDGSTALYDIMDLAQRGEFNEFNIHVDETFVAIAACEGEPSIGTLTMVITDASGKERFRETTKGASIRVENRRKRR